MHPKNFFWTQEMTNTLLLPITIEALGKKTRRFLQVRETGECLEQTMITGLQAAIPVIQKTLDFWLEAA